MLLLVPRILIGISSLIHVRVKIPILILVTTLISVISILILILKPNSWLLISLIHLSFIPSWIGGKSSLETEICSEIVTLFL